MAVIHQAVFAVKNMKLILSNTVGRRRNTKDTRWTYYAKEAAVPGEVYEFGEEWFYVPVDENDLKTKLSFWDASDAPTEQDILDKPVKANHVLTTNITTMESMFKDATMFNQNIEGWDTSNVTDMSSMFADAGAFNQDLSSWCVSLITTKPDNFDSNTPAWEKLDRQPVWGTCPSSGGSGGDDGLTDQNGNILIDQNGNTLEA